MEKKNKSWMDRNFKKVMVVLVAILIMSVGLYVIFDQPQHNSTIDPINLADEINGQNWVLFTMSNCPACVDQKKILGNHSDNIIIVTCDASQHSYDICKSNNIQRVPTWVNIKTNQHIEGYQTLENIEVMLNE